MRATRCSALPLPKARFGSGAVSGSVDAGMGLHREADPNVGAAFNIATHSQPVVLTPQTAHFGRQGPTAACVKGRLASAEGREDQLPEGFTDARDSASVRLIRIKCEGATP